MAMCTFRVEQQVGFDQFGTMLEAFFQDREEHKTSTRTTLKTTSRQQRLCTRISSAFV